MLCLWISPPHVVSVIPNLSFTNSMQISWLWHVIVCGSWLQVILYGTTIETQFECLESLLVALRVNSLVSSAQLAVVYGKHLDLDTSCLPEYLRWRGIIVIWGAKMFESILSTVKYLFRENHCNGNPQWIYGKTEHSDAFQIYCGDPSLFL